MPNQPASASPLTDTLSAADLGSETGLDSSDRATRSARVASNEVETVFTLVEFGVGAAAGLASDVLDNVLRKRVSRYFKGV